MELTNEEKGRVFAMHIGILCVIESESYKPAGLKVAGIMDGHDKPQIQVNCMEGSFYVDIDRAKLLLTPLDKITDEDAIEVAKILGYLHAEITNRTEHYVHLEDSQFDIKIFHDTDIEVTVEDDICGHDRESAVQQFFIQKGYAVPIYPYNKTAIELGLAISK